MGACCSISDDESRDRDARATNIVRRRVYVPCNALPAPPAGACYSEYLCHVCGRYWSSTLSWYNYSQQCKRCNTDVRPRYQREVRPTDLKRKEGNSPEHSMELCQKCRELGYYCGIYNKRVKQLHGRMRGCNA